MTAAQLIKKLNKLPQDAVVVVTNNNIYIDGNYEVVKVDYDELMDAINLKADYRRLCYCSNRNDM